MKVKLLKETKSRKLGRAVASLIMAGEDQWETAAMYLSMADLEIAIEDVIAGLKEKILELEPEIEKAKDISLEKWQAYMDYDEGYTTQQTQKAYEMSQDYRRARLAWRALQEPIKNIFDFWYWVANPDIINSPNKPEILAQANELIHVLRGQDDPGYKEYFGAGHQEDRRHGVTEGVSIGKNNKMNFKINNNTGSPIQYGDQIQGLCDFAHNRFNFKNPPSIFLDDSKENASKVLGKTGYYEPSSLEIHVFATGRHPKDILRSIAHELIHHVQNERGDLQQGGYMGQGYAQKNPHMRNMEEEAYKEGNLCLRDYEDSLKENTIYNERRNREMSIKDWKNKELNENLNKKWGFKMDLSKLKEGIGAGVSDPLGGEVAWEKEPPMSDQELAIEDCVQQKVAQGMTPCEARPACESEMGAHAPAEEPLGLQKDPEIPFQEGNAMGQGAVQGYAGKNRRSK